MKQQYSPSFVATLERCGLTPDHWRCLLASRQFVRMTHATRQFIRQVQRVHTGRRVWIGGRLV